MINLEKLQSPIFEMNFCSRDIGDKGVKNEVFRDFFKNGSNDFVHFLTESGYYGIAYLCKFSSPQKF